MYGEADDRVSSEETDEIFKNLKGTKTLKSYPLGSHNVFGESNRANWINDVTAFLQSVPSS
jgi:alpha-beta hydrolase superfamily lysophospholipase